MSSRRILLLMLSVSAGLLLILLLVRVGNINMYSLLEHLRGVSLNAFSKLVLLNVILVAISTLKWRTVDTALRQPADTAPSWTASFFLTSAGMVLGLILPVQLGIAAARTLGTYLHEGAVRRGTAGSLFEESFDVLVVSLLAIASAVTRYFNASQIMWTVSAIVMASVAWSQQNRQ